MEAEVKAAYPGAKIQLIKGSGGVFEVKIDGQSIYSKQSMPSPRFPNEGEISRLIKEIG